VSDAAEDLIRTYAIRYEAEGLDDFSYSSPPPGGAPDGAWLGPDAAVAVQFRWGGAGTSAVWLGVALPDGAVHELDLLVARSQAPALAQAAEALAAALGATENKSSGW
jgi:hypothetical protein